MKHRTREVRLRCWPCVLLWSSMLLGLNAYAESREVLATNDAWRISYIPYYWTPDVDLRLRLDDVVQSSSQQFTKEPSISKPKAVGMALSLAKGRWGFLLEGESFDVDSADEHPDLDQNLEMDLQRLGISGVYSWRRSLYSGSQLIFHHWAGLRYRHLGLSLMAASMPEGTDDDLEDDTFNNGKREIASNQEHSLDPLIGMRAEWFVTPKWSLSLAGDVGGFVDNQVAWNAVGWLKFHLNREFSLSLGYRYNDFTFSGGGEESGWSSEGVAQGFIVGMEVDFYAQPAPQPEAWSDGGRTFLRKAKRSKPASSANGDKGQGEQVVGQWLDRGHDYVNKKVDAGVKLADEQFMDKTKPKVEREKSRLYLELFTRAVRKVDGSMEFEVQPSGSASVDLPNLERRVRLALSDKSVDEKPGTSPFDREAGANLGLESRGLFLKKTRFRAGVRSSLDAYASAAWVPEWQYRRWKIGPEARAYYRTDKGAGVIGSMLFAYRIENRFRVTSRTSVEYGEETKREVEWLQNISLAYLFEGDEEDYHRAIFSYLSISGMEEEGTTRYDWSPFRYRAPLYKKWMYWEIGPEIIWRQEDRWQPQYAIRGGVSALFWGTEER